MGSITQDIRHRLSLIKYGITKAAIKSKNNGSIFTVRNIALMALESPIVTSLETHHHPNQHIPDKIKPITDMCRCNPDVGLVAFWEKPMQRGYSPIPALYRFLRKQRSMAAKPANLKFVVKAYEQIQSPVQYVHLFLLYAL